MIPFLANHKVALLSALPAVASMGIGYGIYHDAAPVVHHVTVTIPTPSRTVIIEKSSGGSTTSTASHRKTPSTSLSSPTGITSVSSPLVERTPSASAPTPTPTKTIIIRQTTPGTTTTKTVTPKPAPSSSQPHPVKSLISDLTGPLGAGSN